MSQTLSAPPPVSASTGVAAPNTAQKVVVQRSAFSNRLSATKPIYRVSTPRMIIYCFGALVLATLAAMSLDTHVITQIRFTVDTIGYSTKPSIVAAEQIKSTLSKMDAAAMNDGLESGRAYATGSDFKAYTQDLVDLQLQASSNITFTNERTAIMDVGNFLNMYYQSVAEARGAFEQDPVWGLQRIKWSSNVLYNFATPAAEDLRKANLVPLQSAYTNFQHSDWLRSATIAGANIIIVLTLAGIQIVLFRRTRRYANPFIGIAFVISILAAGTLIVQESREVSHLYTAKVSAFDSIDSMYQTRSVIYKMNALTKLWLLDSGFRPSYDQQFEAASKILLLTDLRNEKSTQALTDALDRAVQLEKSGNAAQAKSATPKLEGLIGAEMDNITFGPDERGAATQVVHYFAKYMQIDYRIKQLELSGNHSQAVELALGKGENQSRGALAKLDEAIGSTILSNEKPFNLNASQAESIANWMNVVAYGSLIISLVLSGFGLFLLYQKSGAISR